VAVTPEPDTRTEIRDFLATRRARLSPDQVGLPAGGGRRRVPGLRREEVAVLAHIGAEVEVIAADQINEAYERVLASDVRYRFVIDTASLA
jgi:hypothetical protein